jgi:NAD(P)-dependent dehydrogenase (short-subunit alcohol dehydrogenase family)
MNSLKGKKIIITGASSGIGRATAILVSQQGAEICLVGRDLQRLDETKQVMRGDYHSIFSMDFGKEPELSLKTMFKTFGKADGLFHWAGVHSTAPLKVQDNISLHELFQINVFSALAVIKELRKKNNHNLGCSVVLMSSSSAMIGESAISAYASSKAAILGMTKSLASELVKDNMRINAISAGIVKTAMTEKLFDGLEPTYVKEIESKHALGFGEPEDVANAANFLLSNNSKWITGSNLVVDGGYTAVK